MIVTIMDKLEADWQHDRTRRILETLSDREAKESFEWVTEMLR